jgi:Glycosyltransferase family 87
VTDLRKLALPLGLVIAASAWISQTPGTVGDYSADGAPAVDALASGRLGDFLAAQPLMGPFSIILRAPFVALAGAGELSAYRIGALPCVLAAGLLGLYLAGVARRRGTGRLGQALIISVCLLNPLTLEALELGHPEEILTASLAVAAVAVASQGHAGRATLLLGLALATKQWAVIAVLPVLMALPARQLRVAAGAGAIAIALTLPGFLAAPADFLEMQGNAANTKQIVGPWSVWYAAAPEVTQQIDVAGETVAVQRRLLPQLVGHLSHPLIVLTALLAPLALAARRREFRLSAADAMALLALLALLRCGLDPVNNLYYHAPLLLAAVGWDALSTRGLPVRGLAVAGIATLFWRWGVKIDDPLLFNALYTAAFVAGVAAMASALIRRRKASQPTVPVEPQIVPQGAAG